MIGGQELAHPFDGHGLVVSIAFRNGRAFLRSRFVRTEECAGPEVACLCSRMGVSGPFKPTFTLSALVVSTAFRDYRAIPRRRYVRSVECVGSWFLPSWLHLEIRNYSTCYFYK